MHEIMDKVREVATRDGVTSAAVDDMELWRKVEQFGIYPCRSSS
jgi:hypothetical protein